VPHVSRSWFSQPITKLVTFEITTPALLLLTYFFKQASPLNKAMIENNGGDKEFNSHGNHQRSAGRLTNAPIVHVFFLRKLVIAVKLFGRGVEAVDTVGKINPLWRG
jgi:hypothetical protein